MNASINNRPFSGSNCTSQLLGNALFIAGGNFTDSSGLTDPNITLILTVNSPIAMGAYNIDGAINQALIDSSTYVQLASHSGTVIITSVTSSNIVGSFQFTCSDSTKVANGNFIARHY
jgi:hypothetical protein